MHKITGTLGTLDEVVRQIEEYQKKLDERIRTFYALAGKKYASAGRHYDAISGEAAAADADKKTDERKAPPEKEQ